MPGDRIYNYVIDSVNNIINNGIKFYENNDGYMYLKNLIDIYEYVNLNFDKNDKDIKQHELNKQQLLKYKILLLNSRDNNSLYFNN